MSSAITASFRDYKKVHFIGIGGIGMSALARLFRSQGVTVTGSDAHASDITSALITEGVEIFINHFYENVAEDIDCVVYTLAIAPDNPELLHAQERGLPIFNYAEMLGQVSDGYKTIAVSGTHGKTTTTAMIDSALRAAGISPRTIVGSLLSLPQGKTNFIGGDSDSEFFVTEACEYKKSFLNLNPTILVITNIEADHLDFYKDLADVQNAFMELAEKLPRNGKIVCDVEDENLSKIIKRYPSKVVNYRDYAEKVPKLVVLGRFNRKNAAAALAVADILELDLKNAAHGLSQFKGTWRRQEHHGTTPAGAILYDDYAHHPTEIAATLGALRENYPDKKIVAFFQPHLYSRTKTLFEDFVKVFSDEGASIGVSSVGASDGTPVSAPVGVSHPITKQAPRPRIAPDKLFILPIYAAREPHDPNISSEHLAARIDGARTLLDFAAARAEITRCGGGDLVVALGAGDVFEILNQC